MTIRTIHMPENVVPGKRLGRHAEFDERSREFPVQTAPQLKDVDHGGVKLPLDQGNLGSCTGNAATGALECDPNFTGQVRDESFAVKLYEDATVVDGFPGVYPPDDTGSSGLAVCRVLKSRGLITSYRWGFGLNGALGALVLRPFIAGIPWFDSFDKPDSNAIVHLTPNAGIRGGHEICAARLDVERKLVGFWNSWGPSYGDGGRFWMPWSDLDSCLHQQGDVKVLVK